MKTMARAEGGPAACCGGLQSPLSRASTCRACRGRGEDRQRRLFLIKAAIRAQGRLSQLSARSGLSKAPSRLERRGADYPSSVSGYSTGGHFAPPGGLHAVQRPTFSWDCARQVTIMAREVL
jgi:hypothetical protein